MLNIIRMDLFHVLKSKSFYIIIIFFILLTGIGIYFLNNSIDEAIEHGGTVKINAISVHAFGNYYFGLNINANALIKNKVTVPEEVSDLLSGSIVILLTGMFLVLFTGEDENSRFIRNIAGSVKKRRDIIFSRIIMIALFVLLEFMLLFLITGMSSILFFKHFSYALPIGALKCIGLQYLLYMAIAIFMILVTFIIKNTAISMAINLLLGFGVFTAITGVIGDLITQKTNIGTFSYSEDYSLIHNLQILTFRSYSELHIRVLLLSIAVIIICSSIAVIVIQKKDIR